MFFVLIFLLFLVRIFVFLFLVLFLVIFILVIGAENALFLDSFRHLPFVTLTSNDFDVDFLVKVSTLEGAVCISTSIVNLLVDFDKVFDTFAFFVILFNTVNVTVVRR